MIQIAGVMEANVMHKYIFIEYIIMPYIPERRYEDKPDIFTPFVPMDGDTKVEICDKQFDDVNVQPDKRSYVNNKKVLYLLVLVAIFYILKSPKD